MSVKLKKIIVLFLVFSVLSSVFSINAFSQKSSDIRYEPKEYCNATIDQDFAGDCVLVVMDKNISDVNKVYEPGFFGDIPIKSILDLTAVDDSTVNIEFSRAEGDMRSADEIIAEKVSERKKEEDFRQILSVRLPTDSKQNVLDVISKLEKIDGVRSAEPNYYGEFTSSLTPNDFSYPEQWSLQKIEIEPAWNYTTGSNIMVGVVDSGIDTNHTDLSANIFAPFGRNFVNGVATGMGTPDLRGHGTQIAGIIGAVGNNSIGISGVNQNVSLVSLKVGDNNIDTENVTAAVNYAKLANIKILNMSFKVLGSSVLKGAITDFPGLVITAVGNDENNIDNIEVFPASYNLPNMINVGSSTSSDARAVSSSWGANSMHLFAPGVSILTTVPSTVNSTGYMNNSGTSLAAPHVTGVAALIWSKYPHAAILQVKTAILSSVDQIPALNGLCTTGGRLNARKALEFFNPRPYSVTIRGVQYSTSSVALNLSNLGLTDSEIEPLKFMANLQWLDLNGNQISNLRAIGGLTSLQVLGLANNQISNLAPINGLVNLTSLDLSRNQIYNDSYNVSCLSGMTNMSWLDLGRNSFTDVSFLSNMQNLQVLGLSFNNVSDISALSGLNSLGTVDLNGNAQVNNVTALHGKPYLGWVCLYGTSLTLPQVNALRATLPPNSAVFF